MNTKSVRSDDIYETCERTYAVFQIKLPDEFDPSEITKIFGLQPTDSQKKGEYREKFSSKRRIAPVSGWSLSSEGIVDSLDLPDHLVWLLDRLLPVANQIKDLQNEPDIEMWVKCIWWSKEGGGGWNLTPKQMRGFGELNLMCGFELSFYGPDE